MDDKLQFIRWRYASDDKTKVHIEVTTDANELTASQLERAMMELASVRAQVLPLASDHQPHIPPPFWVNSPLVTIHTLPDVPQWFLGICDPGRGWLHFAFPRSDLQEFRKAIDHAIGGAPVATLH